ncbi:ROK family protein, partial [uncultured Faecalicoccus sp.]|uniref:ROK family protein n=1 Tax=uncultured Faecalicoccus sp. TaxID=1971760 RepID=UPI0026283DA3
MKTFIAVDLGGTNIRAALVQEDGKILEVKKDRTEANLGKEHVMEKMENLISSLKDYENAEGIGLGIPGP